MISCQSNSQPLSPPLSKRKIRLHRATVAFLGIVGFFCAILAGWFTDLGGIGQFFEQIHRSQDNLPLVFQAAIAPNLSAGGIIIALLAIAQLIPKLSPVPRLWSRSIVVAILLAFAIRYLVWRSLSTLNLENPLNGTFSLGLFLMELFVIFGYIVQLFLMLGERSRSREADRYSLAVLDGSYQPSVDILIPTYNEPAFVLKRTLIGCQALEYSNKQVYLLDDKRRPEIKKLARKLGCHYITRNNNLHAKAGNLNNGIAQTDGELIVCFDADFVPTKNFLTRTVGFFQNPKMGLLQTHQCFYNPDLIARNLGIEAHLTHEVEMFSRHYQLLRDGADSSLCYGSAFVLRRSAIEEVGGFVTGTLSEDYFTGIRLSSRGYEVVYLDENLSAGLVAENMAGHISQRQRWTRGTLQAFFIETNPVTIPGLSLRQRIAHLEGILQWFTSICRVGFLLAPFAYYFFSIIPIRITVSEWLFFFLPYYFLQLSTFSWLNHRSRSALISDVYSIVQCFPVSFAAIQTMLSPFSQGFKVTPKGVSRDRFSVNWTLALPLILLFVGTLAGMGWSAYQGRWHSGEWFVIGLCWSVYNVLVLAIALLSLIDVPQTDSAAWFDLRQDVGLEFGEHSFSGATVNVSETGATIDLKQASLPEFVKVGTPLTLSIPEENFSLSASISHIEHRDRYPTLCLTFESVSLEQQRRLIEMLFCRPGQWKRQETPGEWQLLGLFIKSLFGPRVLTRNTRVSAMAVAGK